MFDFSQLLRDLHDEKARLDRVIATLEELATVRSANGEGGAAVRSRRGRKGMNDEERKEVSERMRKYWASRRAQRLSGS